MGVQESVTLREVALELLREWFPNEGIGKDWELLRGRLTGLIDEAATKELYAPVIRSLVTGKDWVDWGRWTRSAAKRGSRGNEEIIYAVIVMKALGRGETPENAIRDMKEMMTRELRCSVSSTVSDFYNEKNAFAECCMKDGSLLR
jgi:hypothetical protein